MSTRRVQSSAIKPRTLGANVAITPWVRNPSWLALTAVGDSEEKFSGLVAVFPQGSYLALIAAGNYTVNWGDGTTANVNSGDTALKLYDFADLANTNAPVTLTDAGDLVERTAHGYSNGMEVQFYNIISTTGLTAAQTYYVINATANDFQVAEVVGGSAIALSTNGSATLLPYKQAIVTVTPNGGTLTSININVKNTTSGLQAYETGWLDIEVGSPNFTSLTIGGTAVRSAMCERAAVRSIGSVTNLGNLFTNFRELEQVILPNTSAVTGMSQMFIGCINLVTVPLFDTSAVTGMSAMFEGCSSLSVLPLFNTAAVTGMNSMLRDCRSLDNVPLFNTAAVTAMNSMFLNCSNLSTVPPFNTAAVTNMTGMFNGCLSLSNVPFLNTAAATNMSSMFNNCANLSTVPPFNTAAVTNMTGMFQNCTSLSVIPLFNTAAVTNVSNMFNGCNSLSSVPALNVSAVSSLSGFNNMFLNCNSISRIEASNFNYTFSVASCKLGATELNEIYTNLPVVVGKTITVSNNVGTTGDDPTIAEDKGWTVAV
jgi:surface protein